MNEPIVELPENPTRTELLHAATSAYNYANKLQREADRWRRLGRNLSARSIQADVRADDIRDNKIRRHDT